MVHATREMSEEPNSEAVAHPRRSGEWTTAHRRSAAWILAKPIVFVLVAAVLLAALACRLRWGYWLVRPGSGAPAARMATMERFSVFADDHTFSDKSRALWELAAEERNEIGAAPFGQLPRAFLARGLVPEQEGEVPEEVCREVLRLIDVPASAVSYGTCYALGRSPSGERVVVAGVFDWTRGTKPYPYWEVVASGGDQLALDRLVHYRWEIGDWEGEGLYLAPYFLAGGLAIYCLYLAIRCLFVFARVLRIAIAGAIRPVPDS